MNDNKKDKTHKKIGGAADLFLLIALFLCSVMIGYDIIRMILQ